MELPPTGKLALIVEYDGTRYHGFQFQVGVPTIQGEIEGALKKITGEKVRIVAAGRTDAGVHANGQVISFRYRSNLSLQTLIKALNFYLAPDISVKGGGWVDDRFSARRDALSREYLYSVLNSPTPSPLLRWYSYFMPMALNTGAMNEACQVLVGQHDFASFTGPMQGKRTVRNVLKVEVSRKGELVCFSMEADSFLPRQVRSTMGCLLRVGLGKLTVEGFKEILQAKKPGLAAPVAPAHGLCLMKVRYPEHKFEVV